MGKVDKLGDETKRAREAAIVKRNVAKRKTAFFELGGAHDLSEALSQLAVDIFA